jgi:hypothetical protein
MEKRDVWEIINQKDIPIDYRCIKKKWIFKVKRNGIFRARLVACGYSQVSGIDFNESLTPVLNDISFRIMLIEKLKLRKTIYGLVHSARKFYEKLINVLKVIGFHGSNLIRVCGQRGTKKQITR